MSEPPDRPDRERQQSQEAADRRRRRALVFGEVLPEATADDRDEGWGEAGRGETDDWLRRQVPPHHG